MLLMSSVFRRVMFIRALSVYFDTFQEYIYILLITYSMYSIQLHVSIFTIFLWPFKNPNLLYVCIILWGFQVSPRCSLMLFTLSSCEGKHDKTQWLWQECKNTPLKSFYWCICILMYFQGQKGCSLWLTTIFSLMTFAYSQGFVFCSNRKLFDPHNTRSFFVAVFVRTAVFFS